MHGKEKPLEVLELLSDSKRFLFTLSSMQCLKPVGFTGPFFPRSNASSYQGYSKIHVNQ